MWDCRAYMPTNHNTVAVLFIVIFFNVCIVDKFCCLVVYENSRAASVPQKRNPGVLPNLGLLAPVDPVLVSIAGIKARARNRVLEKPTVASMIWDIWESEW